MARTTRCIRPAFVNTSPRDQMPCSPRRPESSDPAASRSSRHRVSTPLVVCWRLCTSSASGRLTSRFINTPSLRMSSPRECAMSSSMSSRSTCTAASLRSRTMSLAFADFPNHCGIASPRRWKSCHPFDKFSATPGSGSPASVNRDRSGRLGDIEVRLQRAHPPQAARWRDGVGRHVGHGHGHGHGHGIRHRHGGDRCQASFQYGTCPALGG